MNPFKDQGDLLPITSINRLYVDDHKAYDLFHSALIKASLIQVIKPYTKDSLDTLTLSEIMQIAEKINIDTLQLHIQHVIEAYGRHLASIIRTLFKPSELSKKNHLEWKDIHFDYWASIKTLYLAGGAIIDPFIEPFKLAVEHELTKHNISKNIIFLSHSDDLGIRGMMSIYQKMGTLILLDLGQTSIKRAIYTRNDVKHEHIKLPNIPAQHLFSKDPLHDDVLASAELLHQYLVSLIHDIIIDHRIEPDTIYISIANYVKQGCLQPGRHSYGMLDVLGHPYDQYLQDALAKILPYPLQVKLFHDASAMALNFINQEKAAIISVGTAFGVGFTEE